ncbi:hypothetical protein [Dickeya lacustris]|uniref:Uncharacterized protein n=1 Tax=Dickeya lacustris TaxID=2259638 RepID=A0ABY8G5M7_9GAMM|nr:hypothetical protein [Dickeya lacustris]WFN55238.1 hypothetical protein O1Q98_16715 [Dickeya lacustris]
MRAGLGIPVGQEPKGNAVTDDDEGSTVKDERGNVSKDCGLGRPSRTSFQGRAGKQQGGGIATNEPEGTEKSVPSFLWYLFSIAYRFLCSALAWWQVL